MSGKGKMRTEESPSPRKVSETAFFLLVVALFVAYLWQFRDLVPYVIALVLPS